MMELEKEKVNRKRKRLIQILFAAFIAVLLLATLFSNTLQSLTLPKVRTEPLSLGRLVHKLEGRNALQPLLAEKLFNLSGWKVKQIYVKEGDVVKKGQKLILYDSGQADLERQGEAAQLEKQKLEVKNLQDQLVQAGAEQTKLLMGMEQEIKSAQVALEGIQDQYIQASAEKKNQTLALKQQIQSAQLALEGIQDQYIQANMAAEDEFQIRSLKRDIETQKKEVERLQNQYDTGMNEEDAQTRSLKRDIETKKLELESIQNKYKTETEKENPAIEPLKRSIQSAQLDIDLQERKIQKLKEAMDRSLEMEAPFDGRITKLNAVKDLVAQGEPDIVIADTSKGLALELTADSRLINSLGLKPGGKVKVETEAAGKQQPRTINGEITKIFNNEPRAEENGAASAAAVSQQNLQIKVLDPALKGGDQASIRIEKKSRNEGLILVDSAIHRETAGPFIYKVLEKRGALGNSFTAQKVPVQIIETQNELTVVQSNLLGAGDLVIMESSVPLQDGSQIALP